MPHSGKTLSRRLAATLPSFEAMDQAIYRTIAFGFPLLTMVIITGAVWAQYVWQRWWGWDPKETASLVTWLIYAGYLHGRRNRGWQGITTARFAVLGFLAVLFTLAGVNFLDSLHSYGQPVRVASSSLLAGFAGLSRPETYLTIAFFVGHLLAFLLVLSGVISDRLVSTRAGIVVASLALLANTAVLILRCVEAGRLTFTSGYDFSLWFVWGITVVGLWVALRRTPLALVASLPVALLICMYGYLYFPHKGHVPLPPALQNKLWLHVHVALAIFAYGALALGAGWGALYLLKSALAGRGAAAEGAVRAAGK